MNLLADENFPRAAIELLRESGHDVRSIAEEFPGAEDEHVAKLCEDDERVLLTFDKDFGELIFRRGLRAGSALVLFRIVPESPNEAAPVVNSLIGSGILAVGVYCTVTRDKVRTRLLPASPS